MFDTEKNKPDKIFRHISPPYTELRSIQFVLLTFYTLSTSSYLNSPGKVTFCKGMF